MSDFTCEINIKDTSTDNKLEFDIKGNLQRGVPFIFPLPEPYYFSIFK